MTEQRLREIIREELRAWSATIHPGAAAALTPQRVKQEVIEQEIIERERRRRHD